MIDKIKNFFSKNVIEPEEDTVTPQQIASAALLIEVMVIDGTLDEQELESITGTLSTMLGIAKEKIDELITLSKQEVTEATSLYQFTREINSHFNEQQKLELMTGMWRVAFADGHLDKHEESIMRRVADLLHILQSDYIRCKINARDGS